MCSILFEVTWAFEEMSTVLTDTVHMLADKIRTTRGWGEILYMSVQ